MQFVFIIDLWFNIIWSSLLFLQQVYPLADFSSIFITTMKRIMQWYVKLELIIINMMPHSVYLGETGKSEMNVSTNITWGFLFNIMYPDFKLAFTTTKYRWNMKSSNPGSKPSICCNQYPLKKNSYIVISFCTINWNQHWQGIKLHRKIFQHTLNYILNYQLLK